MTDQQETESVVHPRKRIRGKKAKAARRAARHKQRAEAQELRLRGLLKDEERAAMRAEAVAKVAGGRGPYVPGKIYQMGEWGKGRQAPTFYRCQDSGALRKLSPIECQELGLDSPATEPSLRRLH